MPTSDGPNHVLIASTFGSRILQLLSYESKDIDHLIWRLTKHKIEVDDVLKVMQPMFSRSFTNPFSQRTD